MGKGRLEAFSDGVIAIIITIMVLELKVPHGDGLQDVVPLLPVFLSYVLSFVYVAIYWNNHHHMLHACTTVPGALCHRDFCHPGFALDCPSDLGDGGADVADSGPAHRERPATQGLAHGEGSNCCPTA
jgi:Endosomal/lysosomal potassium channel TMEM175